MMMIQNSVVSCLLIITVAIVFCWSSSVVQSVPLAVGGKNCTSKNKTNVQLQTSANEPDKATAKNSNVYGPEASGANSASVSSNNNNNNNNNNNPSVNRGYNQGYSYNTGIKPYTTGYTYYQPFGDAAKNQNPQQNNTNAPPAQLPVELPNFFGIDPKQLGPVRVVQNQNLPLDENGIPILDAIHIPEDNGQNASGENQTPAPPPQPTPPVDVPVNPNEFTNDFNLNNILSGGNNNNQNSNGMFDFSPPSSNNFNFGRNDNNNGNGRGADQTDFNRLDDFAGNLNNFDTYLGDPSLMLDASPQTSNGGLPGFGQQVPSEIVNLNNAFGSGNNNNNNDFGNILSQLGGGGGSSNSNDNDLGEFGNFGSSSGGNSQQPFFSFL